MCNFFKSKKAIPLVFGVALASRQAPTDYGHIAGNFPAINY